MTLTLADLHPVLGLRIAAGPLELRGITDDDLLGLCALARDGIHPPDQMPFYVPWTDAEPGALVRGTAAYHWSNRAEYSSSAWALELGVWYDGVLVGSQGLRTRRFLTTRTGETGSWLGRAHQGRGIGTRMRQAICAFAFDHLDAAEVTSGAFVDNPASLAVSRKVGYRDNGRQRLERRPGELAVNQQLVLTPGALVRGDPLEVEGLPAFRRLVGLDGADPLP
ncbi:GNAT family N-acetyltransferase [Nocardioides sp. T2.26MG-1]|uniref:GNAT family N-acetyltransferase n=1 Tax=Nocardioides sp. T2.26MG-1 TaxID=3041166 RepID=UPI00247754AD|nr:GNAT family N-acetyltransferase [Nocardioides sp. T2.26MG-1]CAI9419060.1 Putative succinyl-CoA transferase [Nocardioides sp. T2.26MG-1]